MKEPYKPATPLTAALRFDASFGTFKGKNRHWVAFSTPFPRGFSTAAAAKRAMIKWAIEHGISIKWADT